MRQNLLLLCCVLIFLSAAAQNPKQEKKVLRNADIVLMTQNSFDDDMLTRIIEASETDFDISGDALVDLKNKGVSSAVMRAMLQATQNKRRAASENVSSPATATRQDASSGTPSTSTAAPSTSTAAAPDSSSAAVTSSSPAAVSPAYEPSLASRNATGFANMPGGSGAMGITPQQLSAMRAQLGAMGMGGMYGSMFATNYSPEQMPHVFLVLEAHKGKQEIAPSQAQIGQSRYKGGMGAGGMALRSLATEGLSFAAMGAGPGGMLAMSAFSMASGFMPGMRPGAPTMTYVWGLPGQKSSRELDNTDPMFELSYGDIPGVDPDAFEPAVVRLFPTKDNYRLVGATQVKMNAKNMMAGGGPENGKWISEERWPTRVDKEERGFYVMHVSEPLEPGEYAVVLRPTKGYKATPSAFGGGAQVFYSVWDFSVPGTPVDTKGKKKKK